VALMGVEVGQKVQIEKTITSEDVRLFAQVTGDTNPLHLDESYAAGTRFGRCVVHGMLTASLISAALGTKVAPHSCVIYVGQSLRFLRPVFVGDTVTATAEVTAIDYEKRLVTLRTECYNQAGQPVLTGEATVLLDPAPNPSAS